MNTYTIAIHGGAGTILKQDMTPQLEQAYLQGLEAALNAGFAVLEEGGCCHQCGKSRPCNFRR